MNEIIELYGEHKFYYLPPHLSIKDVTVGCLWFIAGYTAPRLGRSLEGCPVGIKKHE